MRTLVLVPGLDGTAELFYRQIPILSRRFRVVTFPLPDDPRARMEDLIRRLREVVDSENPHPEGRVLLCGESFGGALSMSFALAHPEAVEGLVILNSFPYVRQRLSLRFGPPLLKLMPWGAMPLARRFTASRLHTSTTLPDDLREFHKRARAIRRKGYIRRLEILQSYDIRDRLSELETPTLFLAANEDRLVPSVAEARFMAARMPSATVRILEGYGHICVIHHQFDLLAHIEPWLESVAEYRIPGTDRR